MPIVTTAFLREREPQVATASLVCLLLLLVSNSQGWTGPTCQTGEHLTCHCAFILQLSSELDVPTVLHVFLTTVFASMGKGALLHLQLTMQLEWTFMQ